MKNKGLVLAAGTKVPRGLQSHDAVDQQLCNLVPMAASLQVFDVIS
jgi:hypothetical protein